MNMATLQPQRGLNSAFQYICRRERHGGDQSNMTRLLVDNHFSDGVYYRKNLIGHYGCVNAIEFSQHGDLLASGGDDRRVLVWNVHQAIVGNETPVVLEAEHRSNVFAIAFDSSQRRIISAGNDEQVIVHDIHTGKPVDYFLQEQPVFGISSNPLNDSNFAVAGDDGRLLIYDIRDASDPFCLAKFHSAFHSVMFHPVEPRLILSANAKEGAALWDVRMPKKILLKYGRQMGDQCCMNARFNQNGSQVLSLRRRLPPVLYSTHSTSHLFQFNHSSYYNSCTMKSCSFGGSVDQFVMSGSDNFDLHIWRIPSEGSNRWVNEASLILKGHRSIVNQVRYNYSHNLIASSGVEKMIKIWSPFSIPDESCWTDEEPGRTSESPRQIYSHEEYVRLYMRTSHGHFFSMSQAHDLSRNTNEDSRMLAFFDALVQRDIAGLSEEESDADSTYTNTVYSTGNSTSEDEGEPSSRRSIQPDLISTEISQQLAATAISLSPDDQNEEDEGVPQLLDIEDLPIVDSDDESVQASHSPDNVRDEHNSSSDSEDDLSLVSRPRSSVGTSEPNTLTRLIATRDSQLRKLASNRQSSKSKRKDDEHVSQRNSTTSDNITNSGSVQESLPIRNRRRSLQTTPVYECSNNSSVQSDTRVQGTSYQLINNLMTRNFQPTLLEIPTAQQVQNISAYSSSSSSSTSTSGSDDDLEANATLPRHSLSNTPSPSEQRSIFISSEDGRVVDSCNVRFEPEEPSSQPNKNKKVCSRRIRVSKHLKNHPNITSTTATAMNSSDSSTFSSNSESLRKRKKRRRPSGLSTNCSKRLKSEGTPSDSGIDVSKSDVDVDVQPIAGCSHSLSGNIISPSSRASPHLLEDQAPQFYRKLETDSDSSD